MDFDFQKLFVEFLQAVSPALQTLLTTLFVVLAGQASAWLVQVYKTKRNDLTREQQYFLDLIATRAVTAAQQLYTDNEEKREYAFDVVDTTLAGYGINLDAEVIYSAIEAEVFNKFKSIE